MASLPHLWGDVAPQSAPGKDYACQSGQDYGVHVDNDGARMLRLLNVKVLVWYQHSRLGTRWTGTEEKRLLLMQINECKWDRVPTLRMRLLGRRREVWEE